MGVSIRNALLEEGAKDVMMSPVVRAGINEEIYVYVSPKDFEMTPTKKIKRGLALSEYKNDPTKQERTFAITKNTEAGWNTEYSSETA